MVGNFVTVTDSSGSASVAVVFQTITTETGGQVVTAAVTQAAPTSTSSASGSTQSNSSSSSTTSTNKGPLIGGIVGGVGGAILIGGLIAVAWRIWGKNRHTNEEDDNLMDDTYGTSEVKGNAAGTAGATANPFQSNLEQYHNPGRVNQSANF